MLSLHLYTFLFPFRFLFRFLFLFLFLFRFLFRIPHSGFLLFQTPKSTAQFYHLRTRTESRFEETWPVSNSTTPLGTKHHRSINSLPGHLSFCCLCRILHLRHPPPLPTPEKKSVRIGIFLFVFAIFCWLIKSSMVFWWYLFQFLYQKFPDPQDNKTRRKMFVFFIHHWNLGKVSIF